MTTYVGARYMPKFMGTYDATTAYEALSVVDNGSGTSYVSNKPVPAGTPLTDTDYWTVYGTPSGAILNLQNQIDAHTSQINTLTNRVSDDEKAITKNYLTTKNKVEGNLILNHNFAIADGYPQGSCYIGNNKIVCYFMGNNSDTGVLKCYNLSTYAIEWSHSITAYHGNSITYNPNNDHIYICGFMNTGGTLINAIIEISMLSPSVVIRTITLPTMSTCLSLSYDIEKDVFYALQDNGNTPGFSNVLYVINSDLDTIIRTVQLDNYPPIKYYGTSIQGTVLAQNGLVYVMSYEAHNRYLSLYDTVTGHIVSITLLPEEINSCRSVGEVESLIYNYDDDSYYIGSVLMNTGTKDWYTNMYFEIGLYKGITVQRPHPTNYSYDEQNNARFHIVYVVPAGDSLKPSWNISLELFTVPNDAINYFKNDNNSGYISFIRTETFNGVTITAQKFALHNLQLGAFNGTIASADPSDQVEIYHPYMDYTTATFNHIKFVSDINPESNVYCNVFLSHSDIYFKECIFDEVTNGLPYHIWAIDMSRVYSYGGTYDGAATKYLESTGSTVTIEP